MENYIIIAVVAAIIFLAVIYIRKEKKNGKKCIGCPHSGDCSSQNKSSYCSCYDNRKK